MFSLISKTSINAGSHLLGCSIIRPNQSFNPDAASIGSFLLHSFGFPISSQRAAVGTAG